MKIVSWNVNGIRSVQKKGFCDWLKNSFSDVVCVQETKAHPEQLSSELLSPASYQSFFASAQKPGYSGVAIYTKITPDRVETMSDERFDSEGRFLAAFFGNLVVISAYFPNSQEGGARLSYKIDFCNAIKEKCDLFIKEGFSVVLCGDYNIAHKPIDLANPKSNEKNPGFLPEERAWMEKFTSSGYIDVFRHFCKDGGNYTWWSYRFQAREKNIGWRIDYHCVNFAFLERVKSAKILSDVYGSDHCPIEMEID